MTHPASDLAGRPDGPSSLHGLLADSSALTVVCHNNPDPDCLASALALGRIAADAGIDERRILYSGSISHRQNRTLVDLLEIDLAPFDPAAVTERPADELLAFVDHAVPGVNNEVPPGTPVDVVVDHHPVENVEARFVDHRESIGATATILTEYVVDLGIDLEPGLAAALLFAIRQETLGFLRGTTRAEYAAAAELHHRADRELLRSLSNPSVSGTTVDAIGEAITDRDVRRSVLISSVGRTSERDALPQAADYLTMLEGVETAIVFGIVDASVQMSARSTDARVHVGTLFQVAFGDVGSAGGHRYMAGGEVPLERFVRSSIEDEWLVECVREWVTDRLVDALGLGESTGRATTIDPSA